MGSNLKIKLCRSGCFLNYIEDYVETMLRIEADQHIVRIKRALLNEGYPGDFARGNFCKDNFDCLQKR